MKTLSFIQFAPLYIFVFIGLSVILWSFGPVLKMIFSGFLWKRFAQRLRTFIYLFLVISVIYITVVSFKNKNIFTPDQTTKQEQFEKCIENFPSDYVCDSCYKAIYGNKK